MKPLGSFRVGLNLKSPLNPGSKTEATIAKIVYKCKKLATCRCC